MFGRLSVSKNLCMANAMCRMGAAEEYITISYSKCCEISQDLDGHIE